MAEEKRGRRWILTWETRLRDGRPTSGHVCAEIRHREATKIAWTFDHETGQLKTDAEVPPRIWNWIEAYVQHSVVSVGPRNRDDKIVRAQPAPEGPRHGDCESAGDGRPEDGQDDGGAGD